MSASSAPMPELPGMWYDASRNRYFKVSPDHPRPQPRSPARRISKMDVPSPRSLLRARELGSLSKSMLSASLLARSVQRPAPQAYIRGAPFHRFDGCAAVISSPATIDLRHYPSGAFLDSICVPQGVLAQSWSAEKQLVALALRDKPGRDQIGFFDFPMRGDRRVSLAMQRIPGQVSAIALSPECNLAVTTSIPSNFSQMDTVVIGLREGSTVRVKQLRHEDDSQGLVTIFPTENCVITGTRDGNVHRWDLREGSNVVSTLRGLYRTKAVVCVKGSTDNERCFVGCLQNAEDNLVGWDWRITGNGPVVQFSGHRNVCKQILFDVDFGTSGGILMAGGDDFVLRTWDINRGGAPLTQVQYGDLPRRVELVGWESNGVTESPGPGAWVITRKKVYVLEVGTAL